MLHVCGILIGRSTLVPCDLVLCLSKAFADRARCLVYNTDGSVSDAECPCGFARGHLSGMKQSSGRFSCYSGMQIQSCQLITQAMHRSGSGCEERQSKHMPVIRAGELMMARHGSKLSSATSLNARWCAAPQATWYEGMRLSWTGSRGRTGSFLDARGCTANRSGFQRAFRKFDHVCGSLWLQQLHSDLMGNPGVLLHWDLFQLDDSHSCDLHASSCTSVKWPECEAFPYWPVQGRDDGVSHLLLTDLCRSMRLSSDDHETCRKMLEYDHLLITILPECQPQNANALEAQPLMHETFHLKQLLAN